MFFLYLAGVRESAVCQLLFRETQQWIKWIYSCPHVTYTLVMFLAALPHLCWHTEVFLSFTVNIFSGIFSVALQLFQNISPYCKPFSNIYFPYQSLFYQHHISLYVSHCPLCLSSYNFFLTTILLGNPELMFKTVRFKMFGLNLDDRFFSLSLNAQ